MRLGIAHHYGWAVAVTATSDHEVVDRRRVELLDPGLPAAPIHHAGGTHALHGAGDPPRDEELAALVSQVRSSIEVVGAASLDALEASLSDRVGSIHLRAWPTDLPEDIGVLRRAPWESRVDSYMYCQVLAELGARRGWTVCPYDAKDVLATAAAVLGDRADEVLQTAPRRRFGPPWTKDHRTALAATVLR